MKLLQNPYRGTSATVQLPAEVPFPSVDAKRPVGLIARCPKAGITPLVQAGGLAERAGVQAVHVKDERGRMGLGSFKALGAAYVIACDAQTLGAPLTGMTYVTASAGNHGLSVAAGARAFGARAVVYIAQTVPEGFAERLRDQGAEVVREGTNYEASMAAAASAATTNDWQLLSDSSWPGYFERPHRLMEGYLVLMDEVFAQIPQPPTHIFLQAGVGGLAGAAAALARAQWGADPVIVVVEPQAAPALMASIKAGKPVVSSGPVSVMGRLDCKEPSLIALKGLAHDADIFVTLSEDEVTGVMPVLAAQGLATSPSGGAGLAALLAAAPQRAALRLTPDSRVLAILSEGPDA